MAKKKHLHLYKKVNISRSGEPFIVFKCMKPDCSHYIRVELVENKHCECNRCHEPMIMTKSAMSLTLPHCSNCVKRKNTTEIIKISQLLEKAGI